MEANVTDQNKSIDDQDLYLLLTSAPQYDSALNLSKSCLHLGSKKPFSIINNATKRTSPPCFNNSL